MARMNKVDYDLIMALKKAPQKFSTAEIAFRMGRAPQSISRVLAAHKLVEKNDIDTLIDRTIRKDLSVSMVVWAFNSIGKEVPEEYWDGINNAEDKEPELADTEAEENTDYLTALGDSIFAELRVQTRLLQKLVNIWEGVE